jgi:hypothetical protein
MVEAGLRGGVSMIIHKFDKANNPYVHGYDPEQRSKYLMYLDANNLYGWAMSQKMPISAFQWMTDDQLENFDVQTIADDSDEGYILEVDLDYPHELHNLHNDLPLAPQSRIVSKVEHSPYTKSLAEKLKIKGQPCRKLVSDLHPKSRYILHYRNLKLYLRLGMKLHAIHRGIQFDQSYWLRDYISLNTEKRKIAKNSFEKDYFKLMNNSIFGKTMENVRSHVNVELVHTEREMKRLAKKPSFSSFTIINPELTAVQMKATTVKLFKPIYVGFSIMDISKILMFEFHYDIIKPQYGDRAKLCFTDTDSFLYSIETDDVYRDMAQKRHLYDTSDYPRDHYLFNEENKKVLGKMKDETSGSPITEFVGLRPKMYSFKIGNAEKKTGKGIKKSVVQKQIRHHMYRDALFNETQSFATMRFIRSFNHKLYSVVATKKALVPYDDKRFVLNDKVTTRAYGHFLN